MNTPIKPSDINTKNHFWNTFDHNETEVSARFLVRFAQERGNWDDFTKDEIDRFSKHDFWFNRLIRDEYIVDHGDGRYSFTARFVGQCYAHNPAEAASVTA